MAEDTFSIEEIIQRNVVDACDKINKPKQTACDVSKKLDPVKVALTEEVPAQSLNRCNPERPDAPPSMEMTSYSEKTFPVSKLSEKEVQQVFAYVSKQKSRYVLNEGWAATNVCAARSHLIAGDIADDCKVRSGKIFVSPSRSAWTLWLGKNSLYVDAKGKKLRWDKFHVANVIQVERNGQVEPYVIDPILFDKAVPLKVWEQLVKSNDPSASSWMTSHSAFEPADRSLDDPSNAMNYRQAEQLIENARRDQRILRKAKSL